MDCNYLHFRHGGLQGACVVALLTTTKRKRLSPFGSGDAENQCPVAPWFVRTVVGPGLQHVATEGRTQGEECVGGVCLLEKRRTETLGRGHSPSQWHFRVRTENRSASLQR